MAAYFLWKRGLQVDARRYSDGGAMLYQSSGARNISICPLFDGKKGGSRPFLLVGNTDE
jgi:hypothetical protein